VRQAERGVIEGEPGRLSVPKLHCRGCGRPVPKGRRNWCGEACIEEMRVRNWPGHARVKVLERDGGICAGCGRDCPALERRLKSFAKSMYEFGALMGEEKISGYRRHERIRKWLNRFGLHLGDSLWQADHIVPVVEGGGGCGLDNLRTLCVPCHKRETRELARRRARRTIGSPERATT
jgi:5-methylcytosine-specific restriction endonuclease McrA